LEEGIAENNIFKSLITLKNIPRIKETYYLSLNSII